MGVSGCGKSTLGRALAARLAWRFVEGDTLHPATNIEKMASGVALDDIDRLPFLVSVARTCVGGCQGGVVVSCSALKRRYRDLIRSRAPDVTLCLCHFWTASSQRSSSRIPTSRWSSSTARRPWRNKSFASWPPCRTWVRRGRSLVDRRVARSRPHFWPPYPTPLGVASPRYAREMHRQRMACCRTLEYRDVPS